MKKTLAIFLSLIASAAQAHDSLAPHAHPHGMRPLPDLDTVIVGGIFVIAAALFAYAKFGTRS